MSATTTLMGNTTTDCELRYTQAGKAVASVTIAVSDRKFDKQRNEWVDGDTWFARCTLWGELGEHAAASILKGTRVIAHGRIVQREFSDRDGNKQPLRNPQTANNHTPTNRRPVRDSGCIFSRRTNEGGTPWQASANSKPDPEHAGFARSPRSSAISPAAPTLSPQPSTEEPSEHHSNPHPRMGRRTRGRPNG